MEAQNIGRCAKCRKADKYGNFKPVPIETGEWWFNGCFIQEQNHPQLEKFRIWPDASIMETMTASTFKEATKIAFEFGNSFESPNTASTYL
jgi:hypothetical protein